MKSIDSLDRISVCDIDGRFRLLCASPSPIVSNQVIVDALLDSNLKRIRKVAVGETVRICDALKHAGELLFFFEIWLGQHGQWRQPNEDSSSPENLSPDWLELPGKLSSKVHKLILFLEGHRTLRDHSQIDILHELASEGIGIKGRDEDWAKSFDWLGYYRKDLYAGKFRWSKNSNGIWRDIKVKPNSVPPTRFERSPWALSREISTSAMVSQPSEDDGSLRCERGTSLGLQECSAAQIGTVPTIVQSPT